MNAHEPRWWYGSGSAGWMPRLLAPVGWCYGSLTARRMRRPARYRAQIPVVCVGNFTAGGTGKTPCVAMLVDLLRASGHTPIVLSRGYGGTLVGPHWVNLESDTADRVGDEPMLLARYAPVMVARDRAAGARAIEAATTLQPASVIVMDDGIQNPALAKDLTIAVIDGARGIGNGHSIPAGPLRAPLADQLLRTDALLFNNGSGTEAAQSALALPAQFSGTSLSASIVPAGDVAWLTNAPVVAFAGIGVPERFFATIADCGGVVRQQVVFGDHHAYTADDANRLLAMAEREHATLLTTEKDIARLAGCDGALAQLRDASRTLPIRLQLDAASLKALKLLIASRLPLRARSNET